MPATRRVRRSVHCHKRSLAGRGASRRGNHRGFRRGRGPPQSATRFGGTSRRTPERDGGREKPDREPRCGRNRSERALRPIRDPIPYRRPDHARWAVGALSAAAQCAGLRRPNSGGSPLSARSLRAPSRSRACRREPAVASSISPPRVRPPRTCPPAHASWTSKLANQAAKELIVDCCPNRWPSEPYPLAVLPSGKEHQSATDEGAADQDPRRVLDARRTSFELLDCGARDPGGICQSLLRHAEEAARRARLGCTEPQYLVPVAISLLWAEILTCHGFSPAEPDRSDQAIINGAIFPEHHSLLQLKMRITGYG